MEIVQKVPAFLVPAACGEGNDGLGEAGCTRAFRLEAVSEGFREVGLHWVDPCF